jgi:hypothetical protein
MQREIDRHRPSVVVDLVSSLLNIGAENEVHGTRCTA